MYPKAEKSKRYMERDCKDTASSQLGKFFLKKTTEQTGVTSQVNSSHSHGGCKNSKDRANSPARGQRERGGRGDGRGAQRRPQKAAQAALPPDAAPLEGRAPGPLRQRRESRGAGWGSWARTMVAPGAITCSARNGAPRPPTGALHTAAIPGPGRSHGARAGRQAQTGAGGSCS